MNKFIGVLALAAVCRAVPEAEPQLLFGASPLSTPYAYSPFPYNVGNLYNPYFNVLPTATPFVGPATKVIRPANPLVAAAYSGVIPPLRPYSPHDCVTAAGCAVRTLKDHGIAKREATAEADAEASADPESFYGSYYSPSYYGRYNGFYNGYGGYNGYNGYNGAYNRYNGYNGAYGAYPYGANSLWNYAAQGLGYATGFEQFQGYPAATAPLPAFPAPAAAPLSAPFFAAPAAVRQLPAFPAPAAAPLAAPFFAAPAALRQFAVPAPVVKAIPAPVVHSVPAAPLPFFRAAQFVHAPAPVVRQPVLTPIVKKASKHVTYTHLGAHPIQPTTVIEETQQVVGHHYF